MSALGQKRTLRCFVDVRFTAHKRTSFSTIVMSAKCQMTLTRLTKSMKGGSSSARLPRVGDNIS
jgi:hypothetical protein